MNRPSPYRLDNDYWIASDAASNLIKQAGTLSGRHIRDGMLRMQFNREMSYYAKSLINDVERGKRTSQHVVIEMKREQRSLLDQGIEITQKGAGVIAGALQIATGATICYGSAMTLCAVAGIPMMAHGANNVYENTKNILEGRLDNEGPVRKGYQAVATTLGKTNQAGNIAYGTADIGLSI